MVLPGPFSRSHDLFFPEAASPGAVIFSPLPPPGRPFEPGLLKAGALSRRCCSCVADGEIRGFYDMIQLGGAPPAEASGSQTPGLKDRPGAVP